jgi:hypothetical protein
MATYKDILYKKEDNETWTEWSKRVPDNDEDKLDYIRETIYVKIYDEDKEKACRITDMLIGLGVEDLIPLLESEELLDAKIKEACEEDKCEQCGKTEEDCITEGLMFDTGCLSIYALDNRLLCPDCIPNDDDDTNTILEEEKMKVPTYKFRCECPVDYDRIQSACGEGMIEAKIIPQFINGVIPISDLEVEFKSTLSYEQLLCVFDGVVDAHIAFLTLMPIDEYTGERITTEPLN